jgi:hypothetical protein
MEERRPAAAAEGEASKLGSRHTEVTAGGLATRAISGGPGDR